MSAPFQIICCIIGFVFVFMIYFKIVVRVFDESFSNKAVNIPDRNFSIFIKAYMNIVFLPVKLGFYDITASGSIFCAMGERPNSPHIADFII